jgi:BirA family biotin operon repressor/biotin-[acetyl-CoA-carboxylase] ligase
MKLNITQQLDVLDLNVIQAAMRDTALSAIELWPIIDSTNSYLLNKAKQAEQTHTVCLTEYQTQGRGQQGRTWITPPAQAIAMSILWPFQRGVVDISGLPVVIGVAVAEALTQSGFADIQVKWPNDIVYQQQKVGGILVETIMQKTSLQAVVGIGLNVYQAPPAALVQQPATCLADIPNAHQKYTRNTLVIAVLQSLMKILREYTEHGFAAILPLWQRYDALYGKSIVWKENQQSYDGVAMGITAQGRLQVDTVQGMKALHVGEVSIRSGKL